MQTPGFEAGIRQLIELAQEQGPVALMCAETVGLLWKYTLAEQRNQLFQHGA